ncbi:MAG: acyl-CoA desaturase [Pseudobdellovibrio sp.]
MIKKLNSYFWLTFFPAHLLLICTLINIKINLYFIITLLILWTLISGYGIGVGYHRLLSHKSFKTWYPVEIIITYFGCLAIQGSSIFWVNLHRGYHHPHADMEQDIQSPKKGRLWAYLLWPILIDYKMLKFDFVTDLFRKKMHRIFHYLYFPIIWLTWIASYNFNKQFFFALIMAQVIALHQEFCVNLFCHSGGGYRNFDLPDNSVNRNFFGMFFWGVGYHNNHHARPNEYNFAFKKNEFDPATILVKIIKKEK